MTRSDYRPEGRHSRPIVGLARVIEPDFRPLTDGERATLAFLLTDAVPDVNALRARLAVAEARRSCACGCPTITLRVDPQLAPQARARAGSSAHQVPVAETESAPGSAAHPSLLILFTRDGWLDELELAAMDPGNMVTVLPPTDAWVPPPTLGARRGRIEAREASGFTWGAQ